MVNNHNSQSTGFVKCLRTTDMRQTTNPQSSLPDYFHVGDFNADGIDEVGVITQNKSNCSTGGGGNVSCTYGPPTLTISQFDGSAFVATAAATGNGNSYTGSDGGSFAFDQGVLGVGDFTGDGKLDIWTKGDAVWVMSGAGFVRKAWSYSGSTSSSYRREIADFNGDGRADVLAHSVATSVAPNKWNGTLFLSNGSAFDAQTQQSFDVPTLDFGEASWLFGDANGDGLTDLIFIKAATQSTGVKAYSVQRFYSKGRSLDLSGPGSVAFLITNINAYPTSWDGGSVGTSYYPPAMHLINANNDGIADLLVYGDNLFDTADQYSGDRGYRIMLSNGDTYKYGAVIKPRTSASGYFDAGYVADFNGDGLTDFYDGTSSVNIQLNAGPAPDLMINVSEPAGASYDITYQPSTDVVATKLPFVMNVVKSITASDGRSSAATTDYSYSTGKWDPQERTFLGFRRVTAILPANYDENGALETTRPQVATYFQQSAACQGRVDAIRNLSSSGYYLRDVNNNFYLDTAAPYTCLNTTTTTTEYDGTSANAVVKQRRITHLMDATNGVYDFNSYGDARREVDEGVLAYSGDETTTFTSYYPNVDTYAVGCKASQSVYPGVWTTTSAAAAAGVDWIANKRWYMDQTAAYSSPPTNM